LLNPKARVQAPSIYKALNNSVECSKTRNVHELKSMVIKEINTNSYLEVEYFEIVNANTLETVQEWDENTEIVGCIAVFADNVRLIDNIIYNR
jgi:pantoate--beta-alanine ligase